MSVTHPLDSGDAGVPQVVYVGPESRLKQLAEALPAARVVSRTVTSPFATPVDCVVVEHSSPGHGGFDVFRSLRSARPTLPVVFVAEVSHLAAAIDAGVTDFVPTGTGSTALLVARVDAALRSTPSATVPVDTDRTAVDTDGSQTDAAVLDADLDRVLHSATDDFGESLRLVSGYLTLLDRRHGDALSEEAADFLAYAISGTDRLDTHLDALRRYLSATSVGDCADVDLSEVVATALLRLAPDLGTTETTVLVGDLPTVSGDESQLTTLFTELFSNALRYSACTPTLVVDARECPTAWQVAVMDNGPGMYPAEVDSAFEPFTRLHGDVGPDGAGLGLTICRRIVANHGGSIHVETAYGSGSTVVVTLPKAGRTD